MPTEVLHQQLEKIPLHSPRKEILTVVVYEDRIDDLASRPNKMKASHVASVTLLVVRESPNLRSEGGR